MEQAAHIDLHHPLKHKPYEAKTLEAALNHSEFSHLPFRRQKHLVPSGGEEKAKAIHRLWTSKLLDEETGPRTLEALAIISGSIKTK